MPHSPDSGLGGCCGTWRGRAASAPPSGLTPAHQTQLRSINGTVGTIHRPLRIKFNYRKCQRFLRPLRIKCTLNRPPRIKCSFGQLMLVRQVLKAFTGRVWGSGVEMSHPTRASGDRPYLTECIYRLDLEIQAHPHNHQHIVYCY